MRKGYIPGLDGVRACAALAVMGVHDHLPGFGLGWSGVNCFFVLSGFLITGILLRTKDDPEYFRAFYARRALRIFPAYYFVMALAVAAGAVAGESPQILAYFLLYMQNVYYASVGILAAGSFFIAILHTWTLAVEEQFYLLWPIVVRSLSARALRLTTIGLICAAPLLRAILSAMVIAPDLLLPSQVDQLAWGALLAQLDWQSERARIERMARLAAAALGCTLLLLAAFYGYHHLASASASNLRGSAVLSLLAAFYAALIVVAQSGGVLTLILEIPPLRYLGLISYGLYLYHYPLFHLLDLVDASWAPSLTLALKFGGTVAIAAASYHLMERPLLRLKDRAFPTIAGTTNAKKTARPREGAGG